MALGSGLGFFLDNVFLGWILSPVAGVLTRRAEDTEGRRPCANGGRDEGAAATPAKEHLGPQKAEAVRVDSLLEPSEGARPRRHLDSDLWPPEPGSDLLWVEACRLWGSLQWA